MLPIVHCGICGSAKETSFMVQCSSCQRWNHGICYNLTLVQAKRTREWLCKDCVGSKRRTSSGRVVTQTKFYNSGAGNSFKKSSGTSKTTRRRKGDGDNSMARVAPMGHMAPTTPKTPLVPPEKRRKRKTRMSGRIVTQTKFYSSSSKNPTEHGVDKARNEKPGSATDKSKSISAEVSSETKKTSSDAATAAGSNHGDDSSGNKDKPLAAVAPKRVRRRFRKKAAVVEEVTKEAVTVDMGEAEQAVMVEEKEDGEVNLLEMAAAAVAAAEATEVDDIIEVEEEIILIMLEDEQGMEEEAQQQQQQEEEEEESVATVDDNTEEETDKQQEEEAMSTSNITVNLLENSQVCITLHDDLEEEPVDIVENKVVGTDDGMAENEETVEVGEDEEVQILAVLPSQPNPNAVETKTVVDLIASDEEVKNLIDMGFEVWKAPPNE